MSISRRAVLGASLASGSAIALAACAAEVPAQQASISEPAQVTTTGEILLGQTSEVAVGSGKKFPVDAMLTVLITQPRAGIFRAFSATCTHAGCIVNGVEQEEIACGCHGARFDPDSGMVLAGPAKTALGKIALEVRGSELWITI